MLLTGKIKQIESHVCHRGTECTGRWVCHSRICWLPWSSFLVLVAVVYYCLDIISHVLPVVELLCQCHCLLLAGVTGVQTGSTLGLSEIRTADTLPVHDIIHRQGASFSPLIHSQCQLQV